MATIRRSKTMPTEAHATKFLYTILKQLDLRSIDWNLVATELDISNGHAARMRYSRFKQQMEGLSLTTPAVSKVGRPKKATTIGKSDTTNKSSKQGPTKAGKTLCDKSRGGFERTSGSSLGEQNWIDHGSESSFKRTPVSVDFARQEINVGYGYGRQDHGFAQMPIDPYLLSTSYWKPVPAEPSAFPYVFGAGDPQQPQQYHQQQQYQHQQHQPQQPQFQADHSSNMYFTHPPPAVAAPLHHGDDATMGGFNSSWAPQTIDGGFNYRSQVTQTLPQTLPHGDSVIPMNTGTPASVVGVAVGGAVSAAAVAVTTAPSPAPEDHEHHENCFSGCCHLPPYPPSPSLTPNFPRPDPRNDPHGDALLAPLSSFPAWTPPPPTLMHWVPIKPEPGEEGYNDDILVKVERAA